MEIASVLLIGHVFEEPLFLLESDAPVKYSIEVIADTKMIQEDFFNSFDIIVLSSPEIIRKLPAGKIVVIFNSMNKSEKAHEFHFPGVLHGDQLRSLLHVLVDMNRTLHSSSHLFLSDQSSFLESALDAVIGMNSKGNIIYWNKQAEVITGWSRTEVLGRKMSTIIIPEEYRLSHERGLKNFLETGVGPILGKHIEIIALRKNGETFPVELTVTPIKSDDDYIFSAFVRDISERKKIESEKIEEKEKLARALQSRDEFITLCSHELKTPVTSMKLQFQVAEKLMKSNDPRAYTKETVDKRIYLAIKQLNRMTNLIDDMLDMSRISKGKLEYNMKEVNFEKLVREVLDRFHEQFSISNIEIHFDVQSENCIVFGDAHRLDQVVTNLISNAIKYGEGTPIHLVLLRLSDGRISFSVTDKGIGIEKSKQEDVFKRYERAVEHTSISGLGLGLYITSNIIHAHKGHIHVDSEKGHGATFSIDLPAA